MTRNSTLFVHACIAVFVFLRVSHCLRSQISHCLCTRIPHCLYGLFWTRGIFCFKKPSAMWMLQGCPKQFADIFEHLSVLEYRNRPNYDFIEAVFLSAMRKRCINKDSPIEWNRDQIEENIPTKEKSETNAIADHDHTIVEDPTNPRHLNEQPCA